MKVYKVIRKYWEYITTKIKIIYLQRKFQYNGVTVKYMLKRSKNTENLAIIFSSCTRKGLKARYNYVRTLEGLKCNRLYILDDYSEDGRGSYYLGHDFIFDEEAATNALIDKIIHELSPKKVIFCGSSKGGYAALNFGIPRKDAYIVAGAPQMYLASYLKASGNMSAYHHILGEANEDKEKILDGYLVKKIEEDFYRSTQKVYLHYSNKEHTYFEHVQFLIKELESHGFDCEYDIADYTNHSDISYYFPDYLRRIVEQIANSV